MKKIDSDFFDFLFLFDLYKKGKKKISFPGDFSMERNEAGVVCIEKRTITLLAPLLLLRWICCFGFSISDATRVSAKDGDKVFILFSDSENFGNKLNQDIFGKIKFENGATCEVQKIASEYKSFDLCGAGHFLVIREGGALLNNGDLIYGGLGDERIQNI